MNFPDLPHFRQLQKDLWQWPKSRAAVMVGAGLSLSSEPLPGATARFSTWRQLVRAMFEEMHPRQLDEPPEQTKVREDKFNGANPLRVASEYEATFDRRKLHELIRTLNPDSDHKPGKLHRLLLRLPWADVFTTNYDTLLERTEIFERKYHPVTKVTELTTAFAPRIVKLHGSFPSQTPFIVTEDDYRTYPRDFAPFVNTVQQSLLENAFVLIGFSGDDPNFLEWTGWIRDELGTNHAPIYMVGALSLGNADRSLLAHRGVTPIDLSTVFEGVSTPNGLHASSIEWFLNSLWAARPVRREKWPELDRDPPAEVYLLPKLVDAEVPVPKQVNSFPNPDTPLTNETAADVVARWRLERENYPGWVVAAEDKRSQIFMNTEFWIDPLIKFAQGLPAVDRLLLFREINWRLETSMVPLGTELIEPFQRVCEELFEPVAQGGSLESSVEFVGKKLSSLEIGDAWIEIAFGLLREARETYKVGRWNTLKNQIDKVVARHAQHSDRNYYEAALWEMWNVNREAAMTILSQWQPSSRSQLAALWKSGLLAELDEVGEARTLLRQALLEIRRALRPQGQNVGLLSLEGWCTYLLFTVETSLDIRNWSPVRAEFWERWQELKASDCSPWPHKEYFDEVLKASPPKREKVQQRIYDFDPGQVTLSRNWGSDYIGSYLPAFAYIRHFERVGIPMRLRLINVSGDTLKNACLWIAPFIPFWSPALLIRAGKHEDIKKGEFLSRTQVAAMDPALAERLYDWCLQILERQVANLTGRIAPGSAQESLLEVLSEMLSRLAFKAKPQDHRRTFPFLLKLHETPSVWYRLGLRDSCARWISRLFDAADRELLLEWVPQLVRLPLFVITTDDGWRDPMRLFPTYVDYANRQPDLMGKIAETVDWLIKRSGSESEEARHTAIVRLIHLYYCKLMTSEQERALGELLWSNRATTDLPNVPSLLVYGFLHLPAPQDIDVQTAVKTHILSLTSQGVVFRDTNGRTSMSVPPGWEQPLIREATFASKPISNLVGERDGVLEWTAQESRQLYEKARAWWANDKAAFEIENRGDPFNLLGPILKTLGRLGDFLARVVIPKMTEATEAEWQELVKWLQEVRSVGGFPTVALPYILLHRPAEVDIVTKTIHGDLNGDIEHGIATAAKAIRHWIHLAAAGRVSSPAPSLMAALIERAIFRRKPGIPSCLRQLAFLIVERPESLNNSQVEMLTASLIPWHQATILPIPDEAVGDFPEPERPQLRTLIAELAGALKIWYAKRAPGAQIPAAITAWEDFCASDPLPEVRRAFNSWDQLKL